MEVNELFDDVVLGDDTVVETSESTDNNTLETNVDNQVENNTENSSGSSGVNNDTPNTNIGWMDQFLESNGVRNAEIDFGNETKNFYELSDVEKINVLNQLKEPEDLSEDDKALINLLKEKNVTIDDLVELEVNDRLNSLSNDEKILNADIKSLTDEEINYAYYRKNNPDKTKEEIDELIQLAQEDVNYSSNTEKKRAVLETEMNVEKELLLKQKQDKELQKLEDSISAFVDHVTPLTEIGNTVITEDLKEELLEDLVTVEENGQSKFLNEFLSDPEKMFKANFYLKYGDQIEKGYEDDLQAAYKRGYEAATNGGDTVQHTFVDKKSNKTDKNSSETEEKETKITDLYD